MNRRLAKAEREGRLHEVMAQVEKQGERLYREIMHVNGNGRKQPAKR